MGDCMVCVYMCRWIWSFCATLCMFWWRSYEPWTHQTQSRPSQYHPCPRLSSNSSSDDSSSCI